MKRQDSSRAVLFVVEHDLPMMAPTAPYAIGFNTLADKRSPRLLPVQGALPEWLRGRLLRTGPAKFEAGGEPYRHWFDGLAMLYWFD